MAKDFDEFIALMESPEALAEMRVLVERDKTGYKTCTPKVDQNDIDLAWCICDTLTNYKLRRYHEWSAQKEA